MGLQRVGHDLATQDAPMHEKLFEAQITPSFLVLSPKFDRVIFIDINLYQIRSAAQSCPTLCNHMNCSPPGSSVRGILQARILGWIATSFSSGSSQPRD